MAWAVLRAESGNHTWPACGMVFSDESGMPGSAGMSSMTVSTSTAMTPHGTPPRRARPVTTVLAQPDCDSSHEPRSNMPEVHWPSATTPSMAILGLSFSPSAGM